MRAPICSRPRSPAVCLEQHRVSSGRRRAPVRRVRVDRLPAEHGSPGDRPGRSRPSPNACTGAPPRASESACMPPCVTTFPCDAPRRHSGSERNEPCYFFLLVAAVLVSVGFASDGGWRSYHANCPTLAALAFLAFLAFVALALQFFTLRQELRAVARCGVNEIAQLPIATK